MKTTRLEMGLMRIQAETSAESQAVCGIIEMISRWMPSAVLNNHGCRLVKNRYRNWCVIPDGQLAGTCHKKHKLDEGCGCLRDGIVTNIKKWKKLPWNYEFKKSRDK